MEDKDIKIQCEMTRDALDRDERRLNDHSKRLDKLEQGQATLFTKFEHLIDKISTTNKLLWVVITGIIGFFFYAIQRMVIK